MPKNEFGESVCIDCDKTISDPWLSKNRCRKHYAEHLLTIQTGLSMGDLPDGLPIEDFVDDYGRLDYDAILDW